MAAGSHPIGEGHQLPVLLPPGEEGGQPGPPVAQELLLVLEEVDGVGPGVQILIIDIEDVVLGDDLTLGFQNAVQHHHAAVQEGIGHAGLVAEEAEAGVFRPGIVQRQAAADENGHGILILWDGDGEIRDHLHAKGIKGAAGDLPIAVVLLLGRSSRVQ